MKIPVFISVSYPTRTDKAPYLSADTTVVAKVVDELLSFLVHFASIVSCRELAKAKIILATD